jgi:hypothetical protein
VGLGIGISLELKPYGSAGAVAEPRISLSSDTLAEGASGRKVGDLSVVNGSGSYTFSITADPDNKFTIANGDELTLDNAIDYETATSHLVTIQADNGVDTPISRQFTITVTDVDDTAPTITSANSGSIAENAQLAFALTANESVTWSITGGADQARFEISGSTLRWASNGTKNYESPDDADTNNAYVVQVTATDGAGNTTNQTVTITVTDVASPTITSSNTASVAENATLSRALTANESVTWSIVGGADQAQFEISGSTLRWSSNGTRNYESPADADTNNAYVVTVRATSVATGETADQTITITVTDVDEVAPSITSSASVDATDDATLSHSLTADETVTWSIIGGADAAQFEISGSTLRWASNGTRDYEAPADADTNNAYVVTVRATDTAGNTTNQTITVTVQSGTVTINAPVLEWDEDAGDSTPDLVAYFDMTVLEDDEAQFQLDTSNTFPSPDQDVTVTIDAAAAAAEQLATALTALGTGTYYARVRVVRGGNSSDWSNVVTITIDVTAPTITSSATVAVDENDELAHELTANEAVTWSIVGGADAAEFDLSGAYLTWDANGTKDYEAPDDAGTNNVYNVTVRATDAAGNTTDQNIAVTVNDVSDTDTTAPTITSSATINVDENATLAHTLTANESVTWSIVGGNDAADFEISGGNTLRWASNGTKDYEAPDDTGANNVYNVTVRATDVASNTTDQNIAVTVNDVAEGGSFHPLDLFAAGGDGFFYDFDHTASQMYTDNGTTPVSANNDLVYRVDCQETDVAAVQATSANRFVYKTNSGNPYVESADGLRNLVMASGNDILDGKTFSTIVVGFRPDAGNNWFSYALQIPNWSNSARHGVGANASENVVSYARRLTADAEQQVASSTAFTDDDVVAISTVSPVSGAHALRVNGASEGSATLPSTGANFTAGELGSSQPTIGFWDGPGNVFVGRIYFVFIIDRALTTDERDDFEAWAQTRMGFTF